jgi:apoptosis-inducing factor 2
MTVHFYVTTAYVSVRKDTYARIRDTLCPRSGIEYKLHPLDVGGHENHTVHSYTMSTKTNSSKKNIIVVGGGFAGSAAAKELGTKHAHKYNIILVTSQPYYVHLPALIRITVSHVDNLDKQAFVPYDKLPGVTHRVGTVTTIEETASGQGGSIVLADGERIAYAALLLATGSTWAGPLAIGDSDEEIRKHISEWRSRYAKAHHVVIIGGGAVGIGTSLQSHFESCSYSSLPAETVGEIKDVYPDKQVTLVHSQSQLLSDGYPQKFRRLIENKVRERGANVILGDYVDNLPELGRTEDITTRRGQTIKGADLIVRHSIVLISWP